MASGAAPDGDAEPGAKVPVSVMGVAQVLAPDEVPVSARDVARVSEPGVARVLAPDAELAEVPVWVQAQVSARDAEPVLDVALAPDVGLGSLDPDEVPDERGQDADRD